MDRARLRVACDPGQCPTDPENRLWTTSRLNSARSVSTLRTLTGRCCARPGLSVPMPTLAAMTQNIANSTTTGSQSDSAASEDVLVSRGDDAEGAVGSASPATSDPTAGDRQDTLGGARPDPASSASKDPSEWVTGDEPITGPQASYLDTLAREANEEIPANITKAEASEQIERLQEKTGRGR